MDILKWYSIVIIGLILIVNLYGIIKEKGITKVISFILLLPIIIYLIRR